MSHNTAITPTKAMPHRNETQHNKAKTPIKATPGRKANTPRKETPRRTPNSTIENDEQDYSYILSGEFLVYL